MEDLEKPNRPVEVKDNRNLNSRVAPIISRDQQKIRVGFQEVMGKYAKTNF